MPSPAYTYEITWRQPDGATITERIEADQIRRPPGDRIELWLDDVLQLGVADSAVLAVRNVTKLGELPMLRPAGQPRLQRTSLEPPLGHSAPGDQRD